MNNCPTCGLPMVWSIQHERVWCAIYGDHTRKLSLLLLRADDELHQQRAGTTAPRGRAA